MIGIGPFSVRVIAVALAAVLAWASVRFLPWGGDTAEVLRRKRAASLVVDAFLVGLVAARLVYVVRWWPEYIATPLSIVSIGDGGFDWRAGLPAALIFVWWRTRGATGLLRLPAWRGVATGMLTWALVLGGLAMVNRDQPGLPELVLNSPDKGQVALTSYTGKPMVVNLWATWCPPCQREMPALQRAEQSNPDVTFLMINQGENQAIVDHFLSQKNLQFKHLLLDGDSATLGAVGSRGMPTTLFFDAQGRMVDSHMGEISSARLHDNLQRLFP